MQQEPTAQDIALCSHISPDNWVRLGMTMTFSQSFSELLGQIPQEEVGPANVAFIEMFREACEAMNMACQDMWERVIAAHDAKKKSEALAGLGALAADVDADQATGVVGGP